MSHFNLILKNIIQKMFSHCSTIITRDFNIKFLTKTIQSLTLQALINKYNFKLTFLEKTIINDTQIDYIWTNASIQQFHFGSTQAY